MAKSSMDCGPVGYIYHLSSKQPVGPSGRELSPTDNTELAVHNSKRDEEDVFQFRFVRVKEFGHFGYLEHVGSNMFVHPAENNKLVLREEKSVNALFTFDLESYVIMHRNGKYWHVKGNNPTPENDTACLLQRPGVNAEAKDSVKSDTAKFYFGDVDARHLYPYSSPNVSHDWKLLQAFITPKTFRSLVINYKVGRMKEFSETITHGWKISADIAYSFLKSSAGYDGSISLAESSTLTKEKSVTLTIDVPKDHTVCVWQYVYRIAEYGDEVMFLSNIICDTDSLDKKPEMLNPSLNKDVKRAV